MANFNTNQARHFYVALDYKSAVSGVSAVGDIAVGSTFDDPNGTRTDLSLGKDPMKQLYFVYKNGDGLLTRSDLIPVDNIAYVNKVAAASMNRYLTENAITLDSNVSSSLVNKRIALNVLVRQFGSLDERSTFPVVASIKLGASVTASNIYRDLALALVKALPTFGNPQYPLFKVYVRTSSADTEVTHTTTASSLSGIYTALVVVATAQRWRRGLMSNDPVKLDISFTTDADIDSPWGINTVATSSSLYIPGTYSLADEEWFCYGERGDEARGYNYPNNYEPVYLINPADTSTTYDVMTIQYFWAGQGEHVQKSQKTIRIAAPNADLEALYEDFCLKAGLTVAEEDDTE